MSTHLLMSAGRGPEECSWAVAQLLRRLEADARTREVVVDRVETVDTERRFTLNRRLALHLLRERLQRSDATAGQATVTARWRLHDDLIRGDPTRTERP
ncbi:hypothetical protein [Actinoplanes sp. NPDC020271]|uniref:hypothetical protein n=1 Tax=Actinoplanes sp. NPDC020271 TaxID=3363896 RepID=UPI0037A4D500